MESILIGWVFGSLVTASGLGCVDPAFSVCEGNDMLPAAQQLATCNRIDAVNGRSILTEKARTRAAFVACLAATLIVVGALARLLASPFAVEPQFPSAAITNGFPVTELVIIPSKSVFRVQPDARRPIPALDGSSTAFFLAALENRIRAAEGTESQLDLAVIADGGMRPAHRPRAPPSHDENVDQPGHLARLMTVMSWNCGANLPKGLHRA